jgi:L-alanine-DL-glutamate epimerase-like enolase superfamily enzyme
MQATLEIAQHARARGLIYTPHTWTNGFGFAANLQVFCASGFTKDKELEFPFNPPGWTVEGRDGVLAHAFTHKNGEVAVPTTPGLGVEIDHKALKRYGTRYFVMDKKRLIFFALRDRGIKAAKEIDARRRERRARS